jgi:Fe-S oxidoreductase
VPLPHLADYTARLNEVFARHGTSGTMYAHASEGCLHVRPVLNLKLDKDVKAMRAIAEEAFELVREYKGSHSGEHGDGLVRSEFHETMFGERLVADFREVKQRFDPDGVLNPGKIVDAPKMDDRSLFRFKPEYRVAELKTKLDWSAYPGAGGGFQGAVEMCNNNGACRKLEGGVMCPSYRATGNEKDVTRGRANTLRLAISGQLGEGALSSDEMMETLKLCVSCKACRHECPTGVDMAKMKVEFLHHYKKKHGHTLKDKLVARLPDYAHRASGMAWLLNLRNRSPMLARLGERLLGFSAKRSLPAWQSRHFFNETPRTATRDEALAAAKAVVLFVDTFNGFFESANARAALQVLQAAGYTVHLATKLLPDRKHLCCGRTYLACGMVDEAKAKAREVVESLLPFADQGIAIVGLEPSCLLTLRDEMLAMGLGTPAQKVSQHAMLFEEFLAREAEAGRLDDFKRKLRPLDKRVLLHGHCHQKAFAAVTPIIEVLKLIAGVEPELIESSCCGMAGSFGYEAGHFDVSMEMAELNLLPAVRKYPGAIVVADGTSCRHQIQDGAQREAVHAAVLLAAQLYPVHNRDA